MKRLLVLTLAVCVVLGTGIMATGAVARAHGTLPLTATLAPIVSWNSVGWIILHIPTADMAVGLGTIGPDLFDPVTEIWSPLTSTPRSAWVIANVGFTLTVTAASAGPMPADLTRFQMIGGDVAAFTAVPALPAAGLTLATSATGAFLRIIDIQYQYVPSWADAPGVYAVTVTYTVTAP